MSRVRNKADFQARTLDYDGNSQDDVRYDNVTISGDLSITGVGSTAFTSGANITLDAANRVLVTDTPFNLASYTTAERDLIPAALDGDLIYNTTSSRIEGYQNGAWGPLGGGQGEFPTGDFGNLSKDYPTLGLVEISTDVQFDCQAGTGMGTKDLGPGLT